RSCSTSKRERDDDSENRHLAPTQPSWCIAARESTLGSFVVVLQGDEQPLEGTQRQQRRHQDQRSPQQCVNPVRRLIEDLHRQGRAGDNKAGQEHDEERRRVCRIDKGIVEAALLAAWAQRKKTLEQPALAAARATAQ